MTRLTIKQRILAAMTAHPKLLTFGIALAILSTAIGFIGLEQAYASSAAAAASGDSAASAAACC